MNLLTAPEVMLSYEELGVKKIQYPIAKMLLLGVLAGLLIGLGSAVSATAAHAVNNPSLARLISGLLFSCALGIVMLSGAELFTGNTMIVMSVFAGKASVFGLLKNWLFVYIGNMIGAVLLAWMLVNGGQVGFNGGSLAVYTIKSAASKCALDFGSAVILGIFCNILVCLGVICSLTAKDTAGRIMGAYVPVLFFVVAGFEHCVANMYTIPAALFAAANPEYAALAADAGVNVSVLSWSSFFSDNLLPVTLGNIIGGAGIGLLLWFCHTRPVPGDR